MTRIITMYHIYAKCVLYNNRVHCTEGRVMLFSPSRSACDRVWMKTVIKYIIQLILWKLVLLPWNSHGNPINIIGQAMNEIDSILSGRIRGLFIRRNLHSLYWRFEFQHWNSNIIYGQSIMGIPYTHYPYQNLNDHVCIVTAGPQLSH